MTVYLVMHSGRLGGSMRQIRAAYASQEEAEAQAEHNISRDYQKPIQIEDENGEVLKEYR